MQVQSECMHFLLPGLHLQPGIWRCKDHGKGGELPPAPSSETSQPQPKEEAPPGRSFSAEPSAHAWPASALVAPLSAGWSIGQISCCFSVRHGRAVPTKLREQIAVDNSGEKCVGKKKFIMMAPLWFLQNEIASSCSTSQTSKSNLSLPCKNLLG